MLHLRCAPALEGIDVAIGSITDWVPKAHWRLHSELVLKRTQWAVCIICPIAPCRAGKTILEEHTYDSHHRQTTIGNFSLQLLGPLCRVISGKDLPTEVTCKSRSPRSLVLRHLAVSCIRYYLCPTASRHLGDGCETVRDVRELQAGGRRKIAGELAHELRCYVTHRRQHADTPMLHLRCAPALEGIDVAIGSITDWVPKAHWRLHSELVLKRTQWAVCIICPIAPCRAGKTILEEHTYDSHHRQTTIGNFSLQL